MKNLIIILAVFLSMFVSSQLTYGQWIQRYNGPGNDLDMGTSIDVDDSGNVYVAGSSWGIGTDKDFALIKYNSFGVQMWVKRYNGSANYTDEITSIAVDGPGNIYVTGTSTEIGTDNRDYTTIKYNSNGDLLWVRKYSGPGNYDRANSIAVDGSGNVYVTGTSLGVGTSLNIATIKYSSSGDSLWVRRYDELALRDVAASLAVDSSGNVYIAGQSMGIGNQNDYLLIKYNTSGIQHWARKYNGPANSDDLAFALVIDASGNICVTGTSYGIGTLSDYATIKYNSNGDSLWVKRYNGPGNGVDHANSVALDITGNVYITGFSSKGIGTDNDFATIKYNSSGVQQWIQRYNGPGNFSDGGYSIGVDDSGNIYAAGFSWGNGTSGDYAIIKYNSSGIQEWIQRYNGPANGYDAILDMKVDRTGNVYVTGYSAGLGTRDDITTIKYSSEPGTLNLFALIEGFYNTLADKMVKDTIRVYLRNNNSPYSIVDSAKSVIDSNGHGTFNFPFASYGISYFLVIKHRNSIETWSSQGVMFTGGHFSYDFTAATNKAYGNNLVLKGSKYCIYSGDINQDGTIDGSDFSLVDNDVFNSVSGYVATDVNGDNIVDGSDYSIVDNNTFNFVKLIRP